VIAVPKPFRFAITFACIVLMSYSTGVRAQSYAWCGYTLVEGLSPADLDFAVVALSAIIPNASAQPADLLQTRYSLDRSKVIIEGCFVVLPTRVVMLALLDDVMAADLQTIDQQLVYTIFAPGYSRADSLTTLQYYLSTNLAEWQQPSW
jgi:hypothetical protein